MVQSLLPSDRAQAEGLADLEVGVFFAENGHLPPGIASFVGDSRFVGRQAVSSLHRIHEGLFSAGEGEDAKGEGEGKETCTIEKPREGEGS